MHLNPIPFVVGAAIAGLSYVFGAPPHVGAGIEAVWAIVVVLISLA